MVAFLPCVPALLALTTGFTTDAPLSTNTWHRVGVFVEAGNLASVYIDGASVLLTGTGCPSSAACPVVINAASGNLTLGYATPESVVAVADLVFYGPAAFSVGDSTPLALAAGNLTATMVHNFTFVAGQEDSLEVADNGPGGAVLVLGSLARTHVGVCQGAAAAACPAPCVRCNGVSGACVGCAHPSSIAGAECVLPATSLYASDFIDWKFVSNNIIPLDNRALIPVLLVGPPTSDYMLVGADETAYATVRTASPLQVRCAWCLPLMRGNWTDDGQLFAARQSDVDVVATHDPVRLLMLVSN